MDVTAHMQFTIHVVILLHLLSPKLGMVLDDENSCGDKMWNSVFEPLLNLNSNATWG